MFVNFKFNTVKLGLDTAVLKAYNDMPRCFYTIELIKAVREHTQRNYYDGTILRMLRDLQQRNKLKYTVIDTYRSEYRKILN
jgi:hypothetical protein